MAAVVLLAVLGVVGIVVLYCLIAFPKNREDQRKEDEEQAAFLSNRDNKQ